MSFLDSFTETANSDNRWKVLEQETENIMTLGSSAIHMFNLPFIYSNYVKYCEVFYVQGVKTVLVKTDFTVLEENAAGYSMIKVNLLPEETSRFTDILLDTYVQIKIVNLSNEVSYSEPTKLKVIHSADSLTPIIGGYLYKNKITDYLYEIAYADLDYSYANAYLKTRNDAAASGCTSIRWGDFFGRNLDWYYGNSVTFLVRTQHTDDHYATIGIAGSLDQFTTENIDIDKEEYKALPFYINDGINEKGLTMSSNVVPTLNNAATITTGSKYNEVYCLAVTRYCLDHFASVAELKSELPKHTSIINMNAINKMGFESHWLIADSTETTILEIKDNKLVFLDPLAYQKAVMSNFHLNGVTVNDNFTVYTPADVLAHGYKPTEINHIEKYGVGLERHNQAVNALAQLSTVAETDMRTVLNNLAYTRAYPTSTSPANPVWYTEFVKDNVTIDSLPSEFSAFLDDEGKAFIARVRGDKKTWFTNHASIFDIPNKQLYLVVEEDSNKEYKFTL